MTDETQVNRGNDILNDDEPCRNASNLEMQRRQLIEERWVATHVLAYHLNVESMLGSMLRQTLPRPDRFLDRSGMGPTFAQKLAVCDSLGLLEDKLVVAIRALNRLRNSYAHTPGQELELSELARFLAAVHGMHGVSVKPTPGSEPVDVTSHKSLLAHFRTHGTEDVEGLIFIALRSLMADVMGMFSDEPPEESRRPPNTPLQATAEAAPDRQAVTSPETAFPLSRG